MAISFGDNLDKSFAYANGAFKNFSGWFILIILSMLVYGATFAMIFAMIAFVLSIFMVMPIPDVTPVSVVTSSAGTALDVGSISVATGPAGTAVNIGSVPMMETMYAAAGVDAMLSGLLLGGMLILMLVGFVVMLLASFFMSGFILRVYRGGELNFKSIGKMFWQGIVYFVIMLIYMLPYSIVSELVLYGPVFNTTYFIIACVIIPLFLLIISTVLAINAGIRYAKEGKFSAAFQIGKLCSIVGNIGWLRYLGHIILFMIIIGAVELILMLIPFIGILVLIVVVPFIMIFQAKFLTNLYEAGEALEEPAEVPAVVE